MINITRRPDRTSSNPTVEWSSSENVKFECSLDDAPFSLCGTGTTGSWTGNNVNDGRHKFSVQGKDVNGNRGLHTYTWTIGNQRSANYFRRMGVMEGNLERLIIFKVHIRFMGILNICNLWILLRKILIYLVGRKCHIHGLCCC